MTEDSTLELDDDPFWTVPTPPPAPKKRERVRREFLTVSMVWFDAAAAATGGYLVLALRIYRAWRMRPKGATAIAVTTGVLAGAGYSADSKRRVVRRLEIAGLIEVTERRPGQAVRVRVIDPELV